MKNLKKLSFLLLLLFFSSKFSSQQNYKMQIGDELVYHVEAGEKEYDFTVIPTKLAKTGISFSYKMSAPINKKGTVTISSKALKDATAMYNKFSGGAVKLTDQTSIFASKAMMDAATEGIGGFYLNGLEGNAEDFTTLEGNTSPTNNSTYLKLIKNINGTDFLLDGPIMENENGTKTIRFTDGGGYPFITYMETDFKIYLTKIIRKK